MARRQREQLDQASGTTMAPSGSRHRTAVDHDLEPTEQLDLNACHLPSWRDDHSGLQGSPAASCHDALVCTTRPCSPNTGWLLNGTRQSVKDRAACGISASRGGITDASKDGRIIDPVGEQGG